jgi:hypothetical protein
MDMQLAGVGEGCVWSRKSRQLKKLGSILAIYSLLKRRRANSVTEQRRCAEGVKFAA